MRMCECCTNGCGCDRPCDCRGTVAVPATGTFLIIDGEVIADPTCGEGCTGYGCTQCERTRPAVMREREAEAE